jgi:orotate phosphoribosyltransferase
MTGLIVPSGRTFNELDLEIMLVAARIGFIQWHDEPKRFKSGKMSRVYVNGRQDATENPDFLRLASRKILQDTTKDRAALFVFDRQLRFIGIPHVANGWTPFISAVDHGEMISGQHACHAIMRSELKTHGVHNTWVAATIDHSRFRDILFDNVVTDSGSKKEAAARLVEDGFDLSQVEALVFVDRQQGGLEEMQRIGFRSVSATYNLLDMTYAFQELKLWPTDAVKRIEDEIRQNRNT